MKIALLALRWAVGCATFGAFIHFKSEKTIMKHMTISPSAASFFHNEEAAPVGEALQAMNLRRRCKSVEVVGNPEKWGMCQLAIASSASTPMAAM